MLHKQFFLIVILICSCTGFLWSGCEIGVNPLLFDGAPVSSTFTAATTGNVYVDTASMSLSGILSGIDRPVDSITVFNITLRIDNLKNGTPPATAITGLGGVDNDTLLMLNNVPLSTFTTERSIFDPALSSLPGGASCSFNTAGVGYLNGLLKHPESLPTSVILKIGGSSSQQGLYFDVTLKLYTQVFMKSNQ